MKKQKNKMTEKYLRVTMPDGSKWDIPAKLIAGDRARHYRNPDQENSFEKEFKLALEDTDILVLWASNKMDWADVIFHAQRAPTQEINWQEGWINGNKEVIEK